MSRHNKTFAPRVNRFEAQTIDNIEEQEKYEQISGQDAKISLAKNEVTQITYDLFNNKAFNKIEKKQSVMQFSNKGLHVQALNKALNELGYKTQKNETLFWKETQSGLMNFQRDYSIKASGILDAKTLLKMDKVLETGKDEKMPFQEKEEGTSIVPNTTPPDEKVSISVGVVPMKIKSNIELFEYLDIQIFGRIVDAQWDIGENSYKDYIGKETKCEVSISSLKKHLAITDAQWEDMYKKTSAKLSPAELRKSVQKQIKKVKDRTKEMDNLSPNRKSFIRDAISSIDYIQNTRIHDLLKQLSDEEIADYNSKVSKETTNLVDIEASLEAYIETRDKNIKDNNELETVKTKLYGLEELYKKYIAFTELSPTISNISSAGISVTTTSKEYEPAKKKLTLAMIANGFANIEEFKIYITRYETAFETETVRIGVEMLQHYKHTLYEEEKKLNDDVFLDRLLQAIIKSEAKQSFKEAKEANKAASMSFVDKPNQEQRDSGNRMIAEANQKKTEGYTAISSLSAYTPLINDDKFDKEAFAKITNKKELKAFLFDYILSQTQNVDSVINNIQENPEHIYELDKLYTLSYTKQDIIENSIYNSIITEKHDRLRNKKILLAICQGIFAAAIIAATWGAATPIVIAGGALSLVISIDIAYDTINEYKNNKEFHDVGLLTDDPSLFWVVIAIAGVALDAGTLASVLKFAKPIAAAGKAFNKAEDPTEALAKLESDLILIKSLDTRVQQNILRQAELKGEIKKALKVAKSSLFTTNMMVNPEFAIKLLPLASKYIKSGILSFEKFLIELQTAKIIKEIEKLSPEELSLLKKTFEEAKQIEKSFLKVKRSDINDLLAGRDVTVKSFKEANKLLEEAFPNAKKVRGAGPKESKLISKQKKLFKLDEKRTPIYHKDYLKNSDDINGSLYGHEELKINHPHKTIPHINILTFEGKKVTIYIKN